MVERQLADINLDALVNRPYFPSPAAWEDQVLYFLMLDRFSDGQENGYRDNQGQIVTIGPTPPFSPGEQGNAIGTPDDARRWFEAGGRWVGGTLRGLTSKIGYLKRLGVTAIWVSPIFKQVAFQETYHGYGIQNFLDVDPHFGTRDDLREMVRTAHQHGIYVVLDIILNHAGNVFGYDADRYWFQDDRGEWHVDPRWDGGHYRVRGFHNPSGDAAIPFGPVDLASHPNAWPDGAVWPTEFQRPEVFTQKGRIDSWDHSPEYREGDFYDLKNITLGRGEVDHYQPSAALLALCQAYKFWIAFADLDGFRVDTVKHMDLGATRFFTSVIHEFAQSIGKENFYLIGEITGGRRRAYETLEETGLNAALGIDDIPDRLEYLVKGYRDPREYFDLFRNSLLVQKDSHIWFRNKVVTMYDDHDQVRKGENKARFCAGDEAWRRLALSALALNATTLGIPCIYYGTEQLFDGAGNNDRFLREAMFGGEFGAFRSRGRHFFDENGRVYREMAKILEIRRQKAALRRGRQYLREISGNGEHFGLPRLFGGEIRSVIPWSRLFNDREVLLAINTDHASPRTAWVTIDDYLHAAGDQLTCLYSTDPQQIGRSVTVEARNGKAISIPVPSAGFVIYE
jgi:glycosidase